MTQMIVWEIISFGRLNTTNRVITPLLERRNQFLLYWQFALTRM